MHLHLGHVLDVAQPQAHTPTLDHALHLGGVHVEPQHRDAADFGLVDEAVWSVEAHRLLVQKRTQELRAVVHPQPGRLVGEQPEGGAVRLGKAKAREALDHRPHAFGRLAVGRRERVRRDGRVSYRRAMAQCPLDEALAMTTQHLVRALAAHRPAQPVRFTWGEAGEHFGHLHHLILEDDRAERLAQDRLERRVIVGDHELGVLSQAPSPLDVRVDRSTLDRPWAHDRDLDDEVIEVLRLRTANRLHLRAALDLKDADGVGRTDRLEGLCVVERDAREVDAFTAHARDFLHAALNRREHPQAEQVDLQEASIGARVLVPLDHLPALHRRGHHRAAIDQRPRRDHHPARVLGEMTWQPVCLLDQLRQPAPACRGRSGGGDALRVSAPRLGSPSCALDLAGGQPEDLAQLADSPARAERRKGRHQRGVIAPVALVHARDQPLTDIAGEVQVDVGQPVQILVQEAPQLQPARDRIDVRETRQVAHDRGDR